MEAGIKIGHDEKSITGISDLILYIIDAPVGECVKLAALNAMQSTLSISDTSISNCNVFGSQDTTHNHFSEQDYEQS